MTYNYDDWVTKNSNNFIRIVIDDDYANKIREFAKSIIVAKNKESHHLIDNNNELKRFTTGLMGEACIEKLLGISIIDWTVGNSNYYHHPDIPGYSVGIKTVEQGKFPIIFKNNYYPQIFCITSNKIKNLVFVCGLATTDVLNTMQSDTLILDNNLRARGTKTGFYGFNKLKSITSLSDLKKYKKAE